MRWATLFLTLLVGVALAALVVALQEPIEIAESVTIQAPVEEVWSYLGDSGNARQWSVFFHHIAPLDSLDGRLGAKRRCFRNPDRSGIRWDETVIALVPHRERRIHVYNLAGFALPRADRSEFETRQLYERPSPGTTRLTFTAELREPRDLLTRLLFWLTRGETERIFRHNLANIKAAVEWKDAYHRLHDWEQANFMDGRSATQAAVR